MCATAPNLARDSIVIVDDDDDRTEGFRPMVSSAVWGKRLRRENTLEINFGYYCRSVSQTASSHPDCQNLKIQVLRDFQVCDF